MQISHSSNFCYRCGLNEKKVAFTRVPFTRLSPNVSICEHCERDKRNMAARLAGTGKAVTM